MIQKDTIVTITPDLSIANLDDETVLLDVDSGHYYGMNEVATRIFSLLATPRPVQEIIETLLEEYEVTADVLEPDTLRFLQHLAEHGLLQVQP